MTESFSCSDNDVVITRHREIISLDSDSDTKNDHKVKSAFDILMSAPQSTKETNIKKTKPKGKKSKKPVRKRAAPSLFLPGFHIKKKSNSEDISKKKFSKEEEKEEEEDKIESLRSKPETSFWSSSSKPTHPIFSCGQLPSSAFVPKPKEKPKITSKPSLFALILDINCDWSWSWKDFDNETEYNSHVLHLCDISHTKVVFSATMQLRKINRILNLVEFSANPIFAIDVNSPTNACCQLGPHFELPASIIKSNMQKNIRLRQPDSTVASALQLYRSSSFTDLVRRFAIVILEDCILHPGYPFVVWLACAASKNLVISSDIVDALLHMVYEVAQCNKRDPLDDVNIDDFAPVENLTDPRLSELSDDEACLIRALMVRERLGGLKCDVSMLSDYQRLWLSRFLCDKQSNRIHSSPSKLPHFTSFAPSSSQWMHEIHDLFLLFQPPHTILFHQIPAISETDVVLSAVDFHCSDLINFLFDACGNIISDFLNLRGFEPASHVDTTKMLIWHHRSSLSRKESLYPSKNSIEPLLASMPFASFFNKELAPVCDRYSFGYLQSRFKR